MNRYIIITLLLLTAMAPAMPVTANTAKTFDGWMQGYNCVTHGHKCPLDALDPHLAFEPDFVLYLDKDEYYLLPNIDRIVKAKYVHKPIRVVGDLHPKYRSIDVNVLQVMDGDTYKTIWSKEMMLEELKKRQEEMYGDGGG